MTSGRSDRLVLAAILRDNNPVREYSIADAINLTTMKLVGYTETIHVLLDRFSDGSSVVPTSSPIPTGSGRSGAALVA
jgi:hypothetical protein